MNLGKYLQATVCLEIISADIPGVLNVISGQGVILSDVQTLSEICVHAVVSKKDLVQVRKICDRFGCQIRPLRFIGLYWPFKTFLRRPVIIAGSLLLCFTALWLPSKILFVQVSGNHIISTQYILEQAEFCGINFGSSTAHVRSERVKNEMLARIPQLQWVGINTTGCVAQIQVKENEQEKQQAINRSNLSIYAAIDAVVTYANATKGTLNCKMGQAVSAGDILIFNFVPNGEILQFTGASGEVFGDTMREITTVTPKQKTIKGDVVGQTVNYSVIIGKKEINFNNGSGIYGASCVKMKEKSTLTLPGGFELPVSIIKETILYYDTNANELTQTPDNLLQNYSNQYLLSQMISGRIISGQYNLAETDTLYSMQANYACNELIARITNEE